MLNYISDKRAVVEILKMRIARKPSIKDSGVMTCIIDKIIQNLTYNISVTISQRIKQHKGTFRFSFINRMRNCFAISNLKTSVCVIKFRKHVYVSI